MEEIDFVLAWVDGSDPNWIENKEKYQNKDNSPIDDANADCRYRADSELLRMWFRSVERFAPWVNKIHFVTCGQKPDWLNENHPKLNLVNHLDFIPEIYLPTFNSCTIEMNFHRIEGLAEQFVYFNDDMFLVQAVSKDFFFKDDKPVLSADLRYPKYVNYNNISRQTFNDYCIVNRSFNIRKSIWKNRKKWFNFKELGIKRTRQNLVCYIANKTLPVWNYGHLALPHLKSTFHEIWEQVGEVMDSSCKNRFRSDDQVNQWLCCAWNQAKGSFYPALSSNLGARFSVKADMITMLTDSIYKQTYPQICLNDSMDNTAPDLFQEQIIMAFRSILPNKSTFEE